LADFTRRELLGSTLMAATGISPGARSAPSAEEAQGPFDVRAFGAAGDGKTDDTASIQSAIEASLRAGGGHIHFPSGRYRITRSLPFPSGERVDVTGEGWSSQLLQEADEPLFLWPEGISCREVSVRHLRLLSTGRDKSPGTPMIACLGGMERSFFQHPQFTHEGAKAGGGVLVRNVADTTTFD
jgi:hypothetical protein